MIFYDSRDKRKKYVRMFFIALAVVLVGTIIILTFEMFFILKGKPRVLNFNTAESYRYYYTHLNDKKLSITFDDGPHPIYTKKVAAILKAHNIPATFFLIGENVLKYPDIAASLASDGFEIGNHTFTHSEEVQSSPERLQKELRSTEKIIEVATGKTPLFYRPPFLLSIGPDPTINPEISPDAALLFAFQEGYIPIGADIDAKDWQSTSPKALEESIFAEIKNGHIIILHDGGELDSQYMVQILEETILKLEAEGYSFVPLQELFTPPSVIALDKTVQLGSSDTGTDKNVSLLQWFLHSVGFLDAYSVTGTFTPETESALQNWQLREKIVLPDNLDNPEYGKTGEKTRAMIFKMSTNNKLENNLAAVSRSASNFDRLIGRAHLTLLSGFLALSKSLSIGVIVLFFMRVALILGLFIYSRILILQIKNKKEYPEYTGGVSVLIPAYNEEENIESTIRSVLKNHYLNKEIIVINDGSKDRTAFVVQTLQEMYPEIQLIDIPNGGKANALNQGIAAARGEVIVAMDGDTIFTPHTIGNLVKHFGNPKVGAVAGKVTTTNSKTLLDIFQSIEYIVGQNIEKKVFAAVNAIGVIPGPVGAWRTAAVKHCGGYSTETLVEDQDLTLAINTLGYKVLYEPKAIAYTETPHTLRDFVKQRFRWIYGTFQCAWKYKGFVLKNPLSSFSLIILPNIVIFGLLVPLFYPVVDMVLIFAMFLGSWKEVLIMYLIFTVIDVVYSAVAFVGEKKVWKKLLYIPFQRLYYRQVIYYVVAKAILLAFEGTHMMWGKVAKRGESQRYYFANFEEAVKS